MSGVNFTGPPLASSRFDRIGGLAASGARNGEKA